MPAASSRHHKALGVTLTCYLPAAPFDFIPNNTWESGCKGTMARMPLFAPRLDAGRDLNKPDGMAAPRRCL